MNAVWGWGLAVVGTALGYVFYGWRGVALAVSAIVFWLLLQLARTLRVMRMAADAPVGRVASAVMLQARLRPGLRLLEILPLTHSLGEKVADDPETFRWTDESGASVTIEFKSGRCTRWVFERPAEAADEVDAAAG